MIVKIRSTEGPNFFIPIPIWLFCNRLTAGIAAKSLAQNGTNLTPEQVMKLFRTIRECKKRHPNWVLTEVRSAEGDEIYMKL